MDCAYRVQEVESPVIWCVPAKFQWKIVKKKKKIKENMFKLQTAYLRTVEENRLCVVLEFEF